VPALTTAHARVPRAAHVVLAIVVIGGSACSGERAAAAFNEAARYATEASDLDRYFAYCNAVLGRPYQQYYVRSSDAWRQSFDDHIAMTADSGIVQPPHPLVPFRDFLVEYPPGFFLVALPPALLSSTTRGYAAAFGLFMIALIAIAVRLSIAIGRYIGEPDKPYSARALAGATAAGAVAIGIVVTQRYDAAVSMLLCAMCWGVITRRPIAGGIAAGAAVAIKIVPVVVAILCGLYLAAEGRRRDLRIAARSAFVTIAIMCGPAVIAAPSGVLDMLRYHRDRPLEVGSTGAALLGLWHSVDPSSVRMVRSFGSSNIVGRFDSIALTASLVASIVVVIGIWKWAWRRFLACRTSNACARVLLAASAAIVAVVIATNKVGSPQYLVWLLPLGVLASFIDGRAIAIGLLFAAFVLAQVAYPIVAPAVEALEPWAMAVVLARNLTLVAWAVTIGTRAGE